MKRILFMLLIAFSFFASVHPAKATSLTPLKLAFLAEYEIFPILHIIEQGKDKEQGFAFDLSIYPTGKRLADSLFSDDWLIGASGLVPALQNIGKKEVQLIGLASDETNVNKIYAKDTSDIFKEKGVNPKFPDVYGSANTVRGKTILCPLGTNTHQLLLAWLEIIGLSDSDVNILDTKPEEALQAFKDGLGDVVVLWAPDVFYTEDYGYNVVTSARACENTFKTVLFAKNSIIQNNPEIVKKFLNLYFETVSELETMPIEKASELYATYMKKYADQEISFENALKTLVTQNLYNVIEQKDIFYNTNSSFYNSLTNNINFYTYVNATPRREIDFLKSRNYFFNSME